MQPNFIEKLLTSYIQNNRLTKKAKNAVTRVILIVIGLPATFWVYDYYGFEYTMVMLTFFVIVNLGSIVAELKQDG